LYRCFRQHPLGNAKKLKIIVEIQLPVQAADDVNVGEPPTFGRLKPVFSLPKVQDIGVVRPRLAPEGTQPTTILTQG
jgi:hypothetical protein